MWISSLTVSTATGKPDTGCVDFSSRLSTVDHILEVTTKPIIFDADNGGLPEHFFYMVRSLERVGVSAVILEDKIGSKRNSLFADSSIHKQDSIEEFCKKITTGKKAQVTEEFMVIARIESLILGAGPDDALKRAAAYVDAGADGIMIHSKNTSPDEILDFCRRFRDTGSTVPIIAVPSTYCSVTEEVLAKAGVNIVIYSNQLLRSAYPAMKKTAQSILTHGRSLEATEDCMSIKDIVSLIPQGAQ